MGCKKGGFGKVAIVSSYGSVNGGFYNMGSQNIICYDNKVGLFQKVDSEF